jgi:hypothetical protein
LFFVIPVSASDGDEPPTGVCPVPNYETDRCCPLEASWSQSLPGWLQAVINAIGHTLNGLFNATIKLKDDALKHAHVRKMTERYLGNYSQNYNDGVAPKLMPPTEPFIQDKAERERVHNEWGKWKVETVGEVGGNHEGTGTIEGADWYLPKLETATSFLNDALTRIPGKEESPTASLKENTVCEAATIQLADTSALGESGGTVLAADDELCHEILPGPKHNACVGENSDSIKIDITQAISNLLSGSVKVYPRFSFLDDIADQSIGPTGFTRVFEIPWEPPYKTSDGETQGDFGINLSVNVGGIPFVADLIGWQPNWGFNLGTFNVKNEAQILHTGTEALADWEIKQKLSPPGVSVIPPGEEEEEEEVPDEIVGGSCAVCNFTRSGSNLFKQIISEAGAAYGVPGSVLLGVLLHEGWHPGGKPHVFDFSDETIEQASAPGGRDPYCVRNAWCAAGPFQFLTNPNEYQDIPGANGRVPSTCPNWPGVDVWGMYKNAVIEKGARPAGYTPDPCNFKDAAYAAAKHIRVKTQYSYSTCPKTRTPPDTCELWSETDARHAYCTYQGSCANNYCSGSYGYLTKYSCKD